MNFYQAHTYWESLQKLKSTQGAQKAVIDSVSLLLEDDKHPSLQLHPLEKAKDQNMWSARASENFRIILHRTNNDTVLLYADLHDPAYKWGENRVLKAHPKTGAMQIIVVREEENIVKVPVFVQEEVKKPPPLAHIPEDELLGYGVPAENISELKTANEDRLLEIAVDLPLEAQEAVLVIAAGGKPEPHKAQEEVEDPFQHPDAKSRFRVLENVEELEQALEYEWEKWVVFLHPAQKDLVEQNFNGPARASGTAGTGKTVVALHRTVHLARKDESARILLTTFSDTLAALLRDKLRQLVTTEPRLMEKIEVISLDRLAEHLYTKLSEPAELAPDSMIEQLLADTALALGEERFTKQFITSEWEQVVDAWQVNSWEEYRTVPRIGRKTRLPESRRADLWRIYQIVKDRLSSQGLTTQPAMYQSLATTISSLEKLPYDYAVVDEGQDVSVTQLRFLAALGGGRPDSLFFAGDLGQRIFQQPFSWLALGVDIRGRSRTLKVNYRTSHQIRSKADLLLDPEITDADGNREERRGAISVFNGESPVVIRADSQVDEIKAVGDWLKSRIEGALENNEIGVFVRSHEELDRARVAATNAGLEYLVLDEAVNPVEGKICLGTMHTAKGLEFKAVAVMGCDYNVIPSPERIEDIGDESDLVEVMNTERHLLYVACTRARDFLLVTGVDPASEFLDDLEMR